MQANFTKSLNRGEFWIGVFLVLANTETSRWAVWAWIVLAVVLAVLRDREAKQLRKLRSEAEIIIAKEGAI